MTDAQQREAARQFYYRWNGKGKEDEDARSYWIELLHDILGVERVTERVQFEKKLTGAKGSTERIDVYIPETRVIIEQKSLGIPLDKPQAGHDGKTPYEQAKGYDNYLPYEERARWIVLSNFRDIWIYDLNTRKPEPVKIKIYFNSTPPLASAYAPCCRNIFLIISIQKTKLFLSLFLSFFSLLVISFKKEGEWSP